ncbi:hypothetical protein [Terracidiphilus gabretensis]|uniref:hypothetical protein n=1 Tax=Terracidiphilus gabretensis TaxID=1577687 RepID=UPI0012F93BBC|nr:hypothetical protein [Terracidiphilus gabretensis]
MNRDTLKRVISLAVFCLGILGGLYSCVLSLGGIFTIGVNDCFQEILAICLACYSPFWSSILALWNRVVAGCLLIFAGLYLPFGMLAQRSYMIHVRGFPDQPSVWTTIRGGLSFWTLPLVAYGSFWLVTSLLKWPRLIGGTKAAEAE